MFWLQYVPSFSPPMWPSQPQQGAVVFTTVPSCLSWAVLASSHWTASALWYVSIVLAITGTVFGGQQVLLLPEKTDDQNWHILYNKLTVVHPNGTRRARKRMIFAWQCPVMCLAYSVTCFMGGLMSVVFSPVAMNPAWDRNAKVRRPICSARSFLR